MNQKPGILRTLITRSIPTVTEEVLTALLFAVPMSFRRGRKRLLQSAGL